MVPAAMALSITSLSESQNLLNLALWNLTSSIASLLDCGLEYLFYALLGEALDPSPVAGLLVEVAIDQDPPRDVPTAALQEPVPARQELPMVDGDQLLLEVGLGRERCIADAPLWTNRTTLGDAMVVAAHLAAVLALSRQVYSHGTIRPSLAYWAVTDCGNIR